MRSIASLITCAAPVVTILIAVSSPAFPQWAELRSANVAEVGKGYRTSRLEGREVWNDRKERIGTIADFVIGRDYALFAVLEVGGFLGLGAHLVAVPVKTLVFDEAQRRVLLPGATQKALKSVPEFRFAS
jgi:hypothetical protein